jgi:hypothetical protein
VRADRRNGLGNACNGPATAGNGPGTTVTRTGRSAPDRTDGDEQAGGMTENTT